MKNFLRVDVGPDFENQVAAFVADVNAYEAQMEKVRAKEPGHDPYPAPWAPDHVRAAIREIGERRYASDFQVIEVDLEEIAKEKAAEALKSRKRELVETIRHEGHDAITAVDPNHALTQAKRAVAILRADEQLNAIFKKKPDDITKEDREFLLAREEREERIRAIRLRAAEMESDVEDLTAETINDWKPGAFK